MTHTSPPIDVAAVVDALHARIAAQNHTPQQTDTSAELYDVLEALHEMELTRVISAHLPIVHTTWFGRIVGIVQKITRRLLRWYINPIVEQQNMYNDTVIRTMRAIITAYETNPPVTPPRTPPEYPETITAQNASDAQAFIARSESPISTEFVHLDAFLAQHQTVHAHWPLIGHSPVDHVANALHKLQRRGLRWYINPIVEQMNVHNRATYHTIQLLKEYITSKRIALSHHERYSNNH